MQRRSDLLPRSGRCRFRVGIKDGLILYHLTQEREGTFGSVFTDKAAQEVLRVYRATIAFAGLYSADGTPPEDDPEPDSDLPDDLKDLLGTVARPREVAEVKPQSKQVAEVRSGERELQSGMLSKGASYRVIVSGHVGVKEIERLIKKLEMDKEILAEEDDPLDDVLG